MERGKKRKNRKNIKLQTETKSRGGNNGETKVINPMTS
jgi:hypothetical protein